MTSKYPLPTSEDVPHFSNRVIAGIGFLLVMAMGFGFALGLAVQK